MNWNNDNAGKWFIEAPGGYIGENREVVNHIHFAKMFTNEIDAMNLRCSLIFRKTFTHDSITVRLFRGV